MNKRFPITMTAILLLGGAALAGAITYRESLSYPTGPKNKHMRKLSNNKIVVNTGKKAFTVTLYDNETANDLLTKLPLKLKANNYPGYDEKVIRLKSGLSMKGAPEGDNPEIPEVGYYEPGQWIALYYGHIGYWPGKVPLGRIDATIDELRAIPDNAPVTIELKK